MDPLERAQVGYVLQPIDTVTSINLYSATAGARVARYLIPPTLTMVRTNYFQHGWEILAHGMVYDGAGGIPTTAPVLELVKNGVELQVANSAGTLQNWSRLTAPLLLAETDGQVIAAAAENFIYDSGTPTGAVSYSIAQLSMSTPTPFNTVVSGDLLETWLLTQGAGAGAQTVHPFVIVRPRLFASVAP